MANAPAHGGRRAEGYALVLLAATCWAGGGLIAKWLFTAPGPATWSWPFPPLGIDVDPLVLSAARAIVSTVIALVYVHRAAARPARRSRGRDLPFLAVFGVFGLALVHFAYFKTISLTGCGDRHTARVPRAGRRAGRSRSLLLGERLDLGAAVGRRCSA